MAAVLKKRVVAELCQVTQSLAPPFKKFKSSDAVAAAPNIPVDLNQCKTNKDALEVLSSLPFPIPMDCVAPLMEHLIGYFRLESQTGVKVKILEVLHQLVHHPGCDSVSVYHVLKELLKKETGHHDVIGEIMNVIKTIGILNYEDHKFVTDIVHCSLELIKVSSHVVQSKCLELLGHVSSNEISMPIFHRFQPKDRNILDDILILHTNDSDWRVRLSALEALLLWNQRRLSLGSGLYSHLVLLLSDSEEKVRRAVLKLLWVIAQMNPEIMVDTSDGNEKMVDNCFANICEAMEDISADVRAEAAKLLGSMPEVSVHTLYQTLEKKLMSNFRKKVSAHDRQREMFLMGEWSSGKVSSDAPREKLNPDNISIVSKGACGAFVYGLEDEFSKVRNATLDSLCELSCQHPAFAQQAQDFAVDMLTDEIDSVRLNGISSLHKMSKMLIIRDDQLELILSILKDFFSYMREATHKLLSSCSLSSTNGIKMTISALLHNLSQYPKDRFSIWKTMKALGSRNSSLVFAILPPLLGLHQFFDTKENALDDPSYIALMILASNASPNCPTMTSILPVYIFNHFVQLKNVYPELIPDIQFPHGEVMKICRVPKSSLSSQKKFLMVILSQLDKINFMRDISSAYQLLKIACRDLNKVDELAPDMSASAKFVTHHLKCQIKINEILSQTNFMSTSQCQESMGHQIQQLARTLTCMKTAFIGITNAQLVEIQQLSLVVSALQLLFDFPTSSQNCLKSSCFVFSDQVSKLTDLLVRSNLPSTRMLSHLNTELNAPQNSDTTNYHRVLLSSLRVHASTVPLLPQLDNQLLMMRAAVIEPTNKSDSIHTVVPNYILPIKMIVKLENVEHVERIRIHVQYPNQKRYLMKPNIIDFKTINKMKHKLVTTVMLSGGLWSEPCQVQLRVVYVPTNTLDDLPYHVSSTLAEESKFASSLSQEYIELSEVVRVKIHPSAQRDTLF